MAQSNFGFLLRQARERRGYDLNAAARRLRIRPDVLQAIEGCDYENMPPRGYARNMVNAYARLVGLNPTEITRMYLDGVHDYQRGRQSGVSDGRDSGFDMPGNSRTSRLRQDGQRGSSRSGRTTAYGAVRDEGRRSSRRGSFYADEGRSSLRGEASSRTSSYGRRAASESRAERVRMDRNADAMNSSGVPFGGLGALPPLGNPASGRMARRGGYASSSDSPLHPSMYSGGSMQGSVLQGRLPMIIAGAVILILLVVVISLLTGDGGKKEEDMPSVPVTGLTDTTVAEGEGEGAVAAKPKPVAPTQVTMTYSVADGMQAYIEMYADGAENPTSAETLTGPTEESIDVTGTLRFVTAAPGAVTLMVDGKKVELTEGTPGTGVYEYTVDFEQYLVSWYEEHPEASPGAQAQEGADAESSTASNQSASTAA